MASNPNEASRAALLSSLNEAMKFVEPNFMSARLTIATRLAGVPVPGDAVGGAVGGTTEPTTLKAPETVGAPATMTPSKLYETKTRNRPDVVTPAGMICPENWCVEEIATLKAPEVVAGAANTAPENA